MGITPNVWGPSAWTFIHLMVLAEKEPLRRIDWYFIPNSLMYLRIYCLVKNADCI